MPSTEKPQPIQDVLRKKDCLPHGLVMNLLSAFGNHEAKALTLLSLTKNMVLGRGDLRRQMIDAQGTVKGWGIDQSGPIGYCKQSLEPIGLAAKEELDAGGEWGYKLTTLGYELGIPLAGLLLDFSHRYNLPLYRLLGGTSSNSERRSPQTRYEIIYLILANRLPIRAVDLQNDLQFKGTLVNTQLRELGANGLINYHTTGSANKPMTSFVLENVETKDDVPPYIDIKGTNYGMLTEKVSDVFIKFLRKPLTRGDIVEELIEAGLVVKNRDSLKIMVGKVSNHLVRVGFLTKSQFADTVRSEITLSDTQRSLLEEFISIIDRFENQDGEILAKGRELAQDIMQSPQLFSDLMRRAADASTHKGRVPHNGPKYQIHDFILSNPGCTNGEIREHLRALGRAYSEPAINAATRTLSKAGRIRVTQIGSVFHFNSTEGETQSDSL